MSMINENRKSLFTAVTKKPSMAVARRVNGSTAKRSFSHVDEDRRTDRVTGWQVLGFLLLLIFALAYVFPVFMAFMSAFKTNGEVLKNPVAMPQGLYLGNFEFLFTRTKVLGAIGNTLLLTVISELFIILIIPMSSYVLARKNTRLSRAIYTFFLGGMMIPFQAYMIALFKQMKTLGLFGTFTGTIVIYVSGTVAFGTLLYTSFIRTTVPVEIEEAARIDGCGAFVMFWKIVFPLLAPCTASMVVLNGLGIWNDFLMPSLMLASKNPKTLNVEIFYFVGQYKVNWGVVFAGAVLCITPAIAVFVALQRFFVKGISAGAVKG